MVSVHSLKTIILTTHSIDGFKARPQNETIRLMQLSNGEWHSDFIVPLRPTLISIATVQ